MLSAIYVDSSRSHTICNLNSKTDDIRFGIDSHTNISFTAKHARMVGIDEGQTSTVYPFDNSLKSTIEVRAFHVAYAHEPQIEKYVFFK